MADGSVEFFVALLGEMKIKAANAAEYAERLVAEDYDRELFVEMSPDELKADIGFSGADAKRFTKWKDGGPPSPAASVGSPSAGGASPAAGGALVVAQGGGGGGAAAAPHQQGSRVAAGLGPVGPIGSLTALFKPLVAKKDIPGFLVAIKEIADAGLIPDVLVMAEVTLETARDQKQFGSLKDDPMCIEGIAYIMKYSAEDTQPTFYGDMNNKCYVPDRAKIDPCKMAILSPFVALYCVSLTWKASPL